MHRTKIAIAAARPRARRRARGAREPWSRIRAARKPSRATSPFPTAAGKKPAIVVIHEWWGLNDFVKGKADAFAKQGYVALAVDLYRGKVATDPDMAHQLMRGLPDDRAVRDLKAAVAYLRTRPDVDAAKIGSIGWCMGGGFSLELALAEPTLAGAVIYYGHLVTEPATIAALKVPLLGNFGGQDQGIPPASVREFEAAAKKDGKSVDFKIYPGRRARVRVVEGPEDVQRSRRREGRRRADGRVSCEGAEEVTAAVAPGGTGGREGRPYFGLFLYQSALTCRKCFHFSGIVSSVKMAVTGQAGSQLPHWMQTSGSM